MVYRGSASFQLLCLIISIIATSTDAYSILYPFGTEVGDEMLPPMDDGTKHVSLTQSFQFYGIWYDHLGVCSNGLISFAGEYCSSAAAPLPIPHEHGYFPMIAIFWDDHFPDHTPPGNKVYFRQITDPGLLAVLTDDVRGNGQSDCQLNATWAFVVTFDRVYSTRKKPHYNTFQAVLLSYGSQSIVILQYEKLEWSTKTEVGFNKGDGITYLELTGSSSEDKLSLPHKSNTGEPGRFIYPVDRDDVTQNITCENFECICEYGDIRYFTFPKLVRFDKTVGEIPWMLNVNRSEWIMVGRSWSHFDDPCRFHLVMNVKMSGVPVYLTKVRLNVGSNPEDPEDFQTYFDVGWASITHGENKTVKELTLPYEYNGVPHVKLYEEDGVFLFRSNDCPWEIDYIPGGFRNKVTFRGPQGLYEGNCGDCE